MSVYARDRVMCLLLSLFFLVGPRLGLAAASADDFFDIDTAGMKQIIFNVHADSDTSVAVNRYARG